MSDVKQAVKTSTKIKWQNRWTISESERKLYDLIPMVGNGSHVDMPNPQLDRVLTKMRTGYSRLNKYRNNIGKSPTPLCDCGEEETTEHYILHESQESEVLSIIKYRGTSKIAGQLYKKLPSDLRGAPIPYY